MLNNLEGLSADEFYKEYEKWFEKTFECSVEKAIASGSLTVSNTTILAICDLYSQNIKNKYFSKMYKEGFDEVRNGSSELRAQMSLELTTILKTANDTIDQFALLQKETLESKNKYIAKLEKMLTESYEDHKKTLNDNAELIKENKEMIGTIRTQTLLINELQRPKN